MTLSLDPEKKLKEAREYAQSNTETEFLVVRNSSESPEVGKLPLGKPVQNELSDVVSKAITEIIDGILNEETLVRELDVSNTISETSIIQCAPVSDLPDTELFQLLISRENHGATTYSESPKPDFQFIRISEPDGKRLVAVQSYNDVDIVDTNRKLSLLYTNKEYEEFQGDMLVINPRINALFYDKWLFVVSPTIFESMFNMREEYKTRAKEAIRGLEDGGIQFADRETTTNWMLSNIHMLRDLYKLYDGEIYEEVTPDQIEQMVDEYRLEEMSSVSYSRRDGIIELDVDKYQHTWKLIKLLSGKYAEDEIMGTRWEIESGNRL